MRTAKDIVGAYKTFKNEKKNIPVLEEDIKTLTEEYNKLKLIKNSRITDEQLNRKQFLHAYRSDGKTKYKISTIPREKYKILSNIFLLYFPDK